MGLSPPWMVSLAFDIAGVVAILVTHFGFYSGGLIIGPLLLAIGVTVGAVGAGLRNPWWVLIFFALLTFVFELVFYFQILGPAV